MQKQIALWTSCRMAWTHCTFFHAHGKKVHREKIVRKVLKIFLMKKKGKNAQNCTNCRKLEKLEKLRISILPLQTMGTKSSLKHSWSTHIESSWSTPKLSLDELRGEWLKHFPSNVGHLGPFGGGVNRSNIQEQIRLGGREEIHQTHPSLKKVQRRRSVRIKHNQIPSSMKTAPSNYCPPTGNSNLIVTKNLQHTHQLILCLGRRTTSIQQWENPFW